MLLVTSYYRVEDLLQECFRGLGSGLPSENTEETCILRKQPQAQ